MPGCLHLQFSWIHSRQSFAPTTPGKRVFSASLVTASLLNSVLSSHPHLTYGLAAEERLITLILETLPSRGLWAKRLSCFFSYLSSCLSLRSLNIEVPRLSPWTSLCGLFSLHGNLTSLMTFMPSIYWQYSQIYISRPNTSPNSSISNWLYSRYLELHRYKMGKHQIFSPKVVPSYWFFHFS